MVGQNPKGDGLGAVPEPCCGREKGRGGGRVDIEEIRHRDVERDPTECEVK